MYNIQIIIQQWATKDGCGMIGGLIFSYYSSPYFDSHVKEFRLFADIVNDIGLTLDMIAPYIPKSYLLYVSISATLCRTLCGISAGATKGSITQHFAIESNMADLNAKEGTQETLVSLIGMVLGIALARMIQVMDEQSKIVVKSASKIGSGSSDGGSLSSLLYVHGAFVATWYIFVSLTWVHVWANYVGVNNLRLKSFNRQRAEVVLRPIIQNITNVVNGDMKKVKSDSIAIKTKILQSRDDIKMISPSQCRESLLRSFGTMITQGKLRLGVDLKSALNDLSDKEVIHLAGYLFSDEKYLISVTGIGSRTKINVVLHVDANDEDKLKAFVHGLIIEMCMNATNTYEKTLRMRLITR